MNYFIRTILSVLFLIALCFAQEVGGPYTVDGNTILLMHFDGDLTNVTGKTADGVGQGVYYYIPNNVSGLGQCLRIDNDSNTDSSCVFVADDDDLDMTGNWTIEGWINIFTFGTGSSDWRWVPRLVIKTGDDVFWRPNYFVEMWGDNRLFSCGYQAASQDQWPQVNTPNNTFDVGKWYHLAYIRDTTRHIQMSLIHDENRQLISFNVADYLAFGAADPTPITTSKPLYIGYAGGGNDSWLDGFVDEIRISDVVREFKTPPIITNTTQLSNQDTDIPEYKVEATIYTLFPSATLTKTSLFYNSGGSGWVEVNMTATGEADRFAGIIPKQPVDTKVQYYVKAVDSQGLEFTDPQKAIELNNFYEFSTFHVQLNSMTLSLNFESGSGNPVDAGVHNHMVSMMGKPEYSTTAINGSYSIYLEGDSSYLDVDSPYLNSKEYTLNFWFRAETWPDYCRIINRPIDSGNWYQNCYQVRLEPNKRILAGFWNEAEGYKTATLNDSLHLEKWYHVIFEVQKGADQKYYGVFQIRNEADNFMSQKFFSGDSAPLQAMAPLRIGWAAGRAHFKGNYDDIKIYNYAQAQLTPKDSTATAIDKDKNIADLPNRYSLAQNYPNPFNPTTDITFSIGKHEKVSLVIYDVLGREIRTLVNDDIVPGVHKVTWDGMDNFGKQVASGIYLYKLTTNKYSEVRKMVMMK